MISLASITRIFVFTESTDMRKSFNGLSGLVKEHFKMGLFSGHLFVFFNRRRDFVKILLWDHDGLAIWSKRLESGTFENFKRDTQGDFEIDQAELLMMLKGIEMANAKRRRRYSIESKDAA
jgi:transposase